MVERVECHNNIKGSSEFLGGNFKFVINYTAVLQSSPLWGIMAELEVINKERYKLMAQVYDAQYFVQLWPDSLPERL